MCGWGSGKSTCSHANDLIRRGTYRDVIMQSCQFGGHTDDRSIIAMMLFTTECTRLPPSATAHRDALDVDRPAAAIRHGSWRRVGRRQTGYRHPPRLKRAAIVLEDDSSAEETRWTLADRTGQEGGGRAVVWSSYFAKLPKKLLTE